MVYIPSVNTRSRFKAVLGSRSWVFLEGAWAVNKLYGAGAGKPF